MKKRLTLTLFFSLVSFAQYASAQDSPVPASDSVIQVQADRLSELLRPYVVALDRDMVTFHYEEPSGRPVPETNEDLQNKFLKARSFFISSIDDNNMQGPGIYVSVDPVGSRSYGGWTDPQLYVFTIKKNARLLNTTAFVAEKRLAALKQIALDLRCEDPRNVDAVSGRINSLGELTSAFRDSKNKDCARALITAFSQLGIQGILYNYSASSFLVGCRYRDGAINIISPEIVDGPSLAYFSRKKQIYQKSLAAYVQRLYLEAEHDFGLLFNNDDPTEFKKVPAGLSENETPVAEYKNWRDQHIYKCGARWSLEKPIHEGGDAQVAAAANFQTILQATYRDHEVQNALLELKLSYSSKFKSMNSAMYFSVERINKVEELEYQASGMADDMSKLSQWRQAVDAAMNAGNDVNRLNDMARLLEEPANIQKPFDSNPAAMIDLFKQRQPRNRSPKQPDLLWKMYEVSGYGKRLTAIFVDTMMSYYGASPTLTRAAFADLGQQNAAVTTENRNLYLKVLRTCTALYQDPNVTPEVIAEGECGVRPYTSTTRDTN